MLAIEGSGLYELPDYQITRFMYKSMRQSNESPEYFHLFLFSLLLS